MAPRFLQIHFLTSYPATLLNRDDSGLAKRLPFGEVEPHAHLLAVPEAALAQTGRDGRRHQARTLVAAKHRFADGCALARDPGAQDQAGAERSGQ